MIPLQRIETSIPKCSYKYIATSTTYCYAYRVYSAEWVFTLSFISYYTHCRTIDEWNWFFGIFDIHPYVANFFNAQHARNILKCILSDGKKLPQAPLPPKRVWKCDSVWSSLLMDVFYLQLRTRMLRTLPRIPSPAVPVEHTPRIQNLKTKSDLELLYSKWGKIFTISRDSILFLLSWKSSAIVKELKAETDSSVRCSFHLI